MHRFTTQHGPTRLHRTTGNKNRRDIDAHRGHQHAGGDLVAIRDAHHGVGAVGVDHVLDRIGDEIARWQRVEHPVVAHGDAVIDGDGIELLGYPACCLDLARDELSQLHEVHVSRHKLREGVDHGNDRFFEIAVFHAGGTPQRARSSHVAALGRGTGTIDGHGSLRKGGEQAGNSTEEAGACGFVQGDYMKRIFAEKSR